MPYNDFTASALRYGKKPSSTKTETNRTPTVFDFITSWWNGEKSISAPETQKLIESTLAACVDEAVDVVNKLRPDELTDIIFKATNINHNDELIKKDTSSGQIEEGTRSLGRHKDATLAQLVQKITAELDHLESGELTQLSIVYQDNKGLIQLSHIDLNYLFSDDSRLILTQLLMQRLHLAAGILLFKATSPIQAAALDMLVSSGLCLEDWNKLSHELIYLTDNDELTKTQTVLMPCASKIIIPKLDGLHQAALRYSLSPGQPVLSDIPDRFIRFLGIYVLASQSFATPVLLKKLFSKHPELNSSYLINHDFVSPQPLLINSAPEVSVVDTPGNIIPEPKDVSDNTSIPITSEPTHCESPTSRNLSAEVPVVNDSSNQEYKYEEVEASDSRYLDEYIANPRMNQMTYSRQKEITSKLNKTLVELDEAQTSFAHEPSIWHDYIVPVINKLIAVLNQFLSLLRVPNAYQCSFFKTFPSEAENACATHDIKSSELDDENDLTEKLFESLINTSPF